MNPDLEKWIDEASKGLEPLAREKITEQITEHYQDAVLGYRSSGLDEREVHSRAIKALGSSFLARKKFGLIFLTNKALDFLKEPESTRRIFFYDIVFPIIILCEFFLTINNMKEENFLPMLIFSVIFIACVIYYLYGYVSILYRIKDVDFKRNVRRIYLIFGISLFYHIGSSFSHLTLKHTSLSEPYQMISYSGSVLLALVICVSIIWGSSFQTRLLIRRARALAK